MRFGATNPLSFIPEITEGQHIDVSPQIQKAGGDRVWKINDDLFAINQQIEGQLGHTLGGGKEKKGKGDKKGIENTRGVPPKKGTTNRERRSKQESTQKKEC